MESQILSSLANLGAVGIMLVILVIAVKVLYNRNTTLNDRLHNIVKENTEAFTAQAEATRGLIEVIKGCAHRKE